MTTVRNPIEKAIELSDALSAAAPKNSMDLEEVSAELKYVRKAYGSLLPVEMQSTEAKAMAARKRELNARSRILRAGINLRDYPPFDPECLTWRNAKGYPRLAVFGLDHPIFELSILLSSWGSYRQGHWPWPMPRVIKMQYKDVFALLRGMAKKERKSIRLRATFDGLIPADVKQEIKVAEKQFKSLFIVGEVSKWELKKSAPIRRVDPLLIGHQADRLWLIAAFDTTTLEKYIEAYAVSRDSA